MLVFAFKWFEQIESDKKQFVSISDLNNKNQSKINSKPEFIKFGVLQGVNFETGPFTLLYKWNK